MKKKSIDLKTLWDRHSKSRKIGSTSMPQPVTIESEAVPVPDVSFVRPVTDLQLGVKFRFIVLRLSLR